MVAAADLDRHAAPGHPDPAVHHGGGAVHLHPVLGRARRRAGANRARGCHGPLEFLANLFNSSPTSGPHDEPRRIRGTRAQLAFPWLATAAAALATSSGLPR